ncbi:MAG: PTS sugar transporter subunit IIB [Deltaproteobacteria bacterium]|nr:PTS sugar transporter subunit IIB [Deltaproteobacteria bacterium]MBZ0218844.1 PTS sugar transporter subunit IIB [Deltaproteobacteria bacterium]
MLILIRVDDRLLHGQVICSWVPFTRADALIVASDEAAGDRLAADIIAACGCDELSVHVKSVSDAARYLSGGLPEERIMLVVGDLRDAMRLYEAGTRFKALNLGNIHHEGGRRITPSIIVNAEDEEIMERFEAMGVELEIRDVPRSAPITYTSERK